MLLAVLIVFTRRRAIIIVAALEKWQGNRTKAAEELGISRRTVLNKIKQCGL
jgi:two-component system response regulator AtoC